MDSGECGLTRHDRPQAKPGNARPEDMTVMDTTRRNTALPGRVAARSTLIMSCS
jgi:hypothetical protein